MTQEDFTEPSTGQKIKHMLHLDKDKAEAPTRSNPEVVHEDIRAKRAQHERLEAEADEQIHEREVVEAAEPKPTPNNFEPPTVTGGRAPLSSFAQRPGLDEAAHGGQHHALPDTTGYRHVPEKELHPRSDIAENTALRPSNPNDPYAMDGAGEPSTAGDDRAI